MNSTGNFDEAPTLMCRRVDFHQNLSQKRDSALAIVGYSCPSRIVCACHEELEFVQNLTVHQTEALPIRVQCHGCHLDVLNFEDLTVHQNGQLRSLSNRVQCRGCHFDLHNCQDLTLHQNGH